MFESTQLDDTKGNIFKMPNKKNTADRENSRCLLGDGKYRFACHSGVSCFTRCCHDADMFLYPIDIIRLKQRLGMTSETFLLQHTTTALRDMPCFPNVMLKMSDRKGYPCPFLSRQGCTVYEDRPYSCRAYPLEPAMYGGQDGRVKFRFYLVRHSHCLGHGQGRQWTARQWMDDQQMADDTHTNARWAEIASRFQNNPFGSKGVDSPAMKMAFMASYNMDTFRQFVFESSFLSRFNVADERLAAVQESDSALLLLGFDWIHRFVFGQGPLLRKS